MKKRLLATAGRCSRWCSRRASPSAAATTTTTAATRPRAAGGDLGLIQEGQLLVGTDTPYPAVRDRAAARHLGLRHRGDERDRRGPRSRGDLPGHRVRHDLPRRRATASSTRPRRRRTITPERQEKVELHRPLLRGPAGAAWWRRAPTSRRPPTSAARSSAPRTGPPARRYANDETDAREVRGFPEGPDAITALRDRPGRRGDHRPARRRRTRVEKQGGDRDRRGDPARDPELYGFAVALGQARRCSRR